MSMPYSTEEEFVQGQKRKLSLAIFFIIAAFAPVFVTLSVLLGALLYLHRRELMPRWKHIMDLDAVNDVYLSRLFLVKRSWLGVYLHIIRRDDWSRCQHDHPWAFITIILRGGYIEQIGEQTYVRKPGYIGYRPRAFEHRITELPQGTAVTLVIRFVDHVDWNFRTIYGKMPWSKYITLPGAQRVLWCDDRKETAR